jgi:hypothetical protein
VVLRDRRIHNREGIVLEMRCVGVSSPLDSVLGSGEQQRHLGAMIRHLCVPELW